MICLFTKINIIKEVLISYVIHQFQDLYENVDYGILYPHTKIKVKVNPSGVVMLKGETQYQHMF